MEDIWLHKFESSDPRVLFPAGAGGNAFCFVLEILFPGITGTSERYDPERNEYRFSKDERKVHPVHPESIFARTNDDGIIVHTPSLVRYCEVIANVKNFNTPIVMIDSESEEKFIHVLGRIKNYNKKDVINVTRDLEKTQKFVVEYLTAIDIPPIRKRYYRSFKRVIKRLSALQLPVLVINYRKFFLEQDRTEINKVSLFFGGERLTREQQLQVRSFLKEYHRKNVETIYNFIRK